MIWIASFPRSGNTFLRNILFEVYGLESSTYHLDPNHIKDDHYDDFPFVKTHLLPNQLPKQNDSIQSIYIIRDGRDVMCSIAHHKKDIIQPGTDFLSNMKEAIIAEKGSYFGGWSVNVLQWVEKADIVIRYEDLVQNTRETFERIEKIFKLPKANWDRLPSFKEMKSRVNQYGSSISSDKPLEEKLSLSKRNFRKGKIGSWKEEMPEDLLDLFWHYHGDIMEMLGYNFDGSITAPHQELCFHAYQKLGYKVNRKKKKYVLIEADKLVSKDNDGIHRYLVGLLKAFWPISKNPKSNWLIYLYIKGKKIPLNSCHKLLFSDFNRKELGFEEHCDNKSSKLNENAGEDVLSINKKTRIIDVQAEENKPDFDKKLKIDSSKKAEKLSHKEGSANHSNVNLGQDSTNKSSVNESFYEQRSIPELDKPDSNENAIIDEIIQPTAFEKLEQIILNAIPIGFKNFLYKHNILILHRIYDFFRPLNQFIINAASSLKKLMVKGVDYNVNLRNTIRKRIHIYIEENRKFDIIHLPIMQHYKPFITENSRFLVTIHDFTHLYFAQYHTPINIENAEAGIEFIKQKKANAIAVSKSTYNDTLKEEIVPESDLYLVYEAAEKDKFTYAVNYHDNLRVLKKYHINENCPYLLCLSTLEPRKNILNTIKAFSMLISKYPEFKLNLVIAGKKGWMIDELKDIIEKVEERIIFTGFIDDMDLSAIYTQALALCYFSYYEGFGLPVLESLKCRTPVLYGNNSSLPEIVGKAGLGADPNNIDDMMDKMHKIFTDNDLRHQLEYMAIKESNRFNWYQVAKNTLNVYETILEK